jgi:hypothetical protein
MPMSGAIEASQHDGWDVLKETAGELPSAAGEFVKEAWDHPGKTVRHAVNVAGSAAVMGAAFSYLVPAGGPAAWVVGTALTAPLLYHGYKRFESASQQAANGGNLEAISHALAKDTVSGTYDFGLTFAAGTLGAEGGHRLASSEGKVALGAELTQSALLKAENESLAAFANAGKAFRPQTAAMGLIDRPSGGIINNRLDQYLGKAADRELYFGSLHGHSRYSDGLGDPKALFAKAEADGAHFTAITDHNHLAARDGIKPGDPRIPDQAGTPIVAENPIEYAQTFADAAAATKPGKFVALVGTEMGTIGKVGGHHGGTNHFNLMEVPTFFEAIRQPKTRMQQFWSLFGVKSEPPVKAPDVIKYNDGDMAGFVQHLDLLKDTTGKTPIIQLNHPRYTADWNASLEADVRGRDFGIKSFKNIGEWRQKFGKYASQIELIKGEALNPDPIPEVKAGDLDPTSYAGYLDLGLKLSPTFGRDFHFGEPVNNPAGTGIHATSLSKEALLDALRERRTIATTNTKKLSAIMETTENQPMGTVIDRAAIQDLGIRVKVGGDITPDAKYKVLLWGDRKIGDGKLAEVVQTQEIAGKDLLAGDGLVAFDRIKLPLKSKSAHYVEVQRTDAGSGHTDRMWTAPVWVEPLTAAKHSLWLRGLVGNGNLLFPSS